MRYTVPVVRKTPPRFHSTSTVSSCGLAKTPILCVYEGEGGRQRADSFFGEVTGKERDAETGLYYYGARYLDSKTSRWLSADPALGDYIPGAPINDEARKRNGNLPGMGGVFNTVNFHLYHYAGNNPVKYVDPDGMEGKYTLTMTIEDTGGGSSPHKTVERLNTSSWSSSQMELISGWGTDMKNIITHELKSSGDSFENGLGAAFGVLSTYTGIVSDIADAQNIAGAASSMSVISVITGSVSLIPSFIAVKNDANEENVAKFASNAASVAFGTVSTGMGGLASASTYTYVKAGVAAAKGGAYVNDMLMHRPIDILNSLFYALEKNGTNEW